MPNKSIVPPRKVLPAVSPPTTPVAKRRKGAPVRICKTNEDPDDSDNNQREEEDHDLANLVKQEKPDDTDNRNVSLSLSYQIVYVLIKFEKLN